MIRRILVIVATLACATPLVAQTDAEKKAAEEKALNINETRARRDATLESPVLGTEEGVKFEAEKGEQKATALISFGGTTRRNGHIKVSAPVNKNAEQQELANLQGLTGTAKFEAGYSGLLTRQAIAKFDITKANALCKAHGKDEGCNVFNLATEEELADDVVTLTRLTSAFGVNVSYARTKFDYLTKTTLESKSDSEPGYAGAMSYGVLPHYDLGFAQLYFAGVGFRYEVSHDPGKKQQLCRPYPDNPNATTCSETFIDPPKRDVKRIAELRTRWYASDDIGFDVVVYRNFAKDTTGVEIPIAFYKDKNGLFSGGVVVGWRSDNNELTASVFVGVLKNLL
jgi:hypothetical protein